MVASLADKPSRRKESMSKSKAVTSRDAGEKDEELEKAKKEFAKESEKKEPRTPPDQGETIVEKVEPKPKPKKKVPKSMKDMVPKVEKKKKRSDREYKIQKQAHGSMMDQGINLGDTGAIPPVKEWRISSDRRVMLKVSNKQSAMTAANQ